ncbi:unnamed protein product [Caenorhabditis bovis]|uniref:ditrans,polycis-polyprenyl diphosphate synthase [(2E,6E)-farnesyldiphosphate specific] n=1 Tax=Caenorhabditis bovis TaxID=2654633 RepID=A0A8S1EWB1_9PELO|nr:unnamed protein product [Caenorhabditis bovis]
MIDIGWICGAAVRAVYWLVMLVCNFMGYSPLWAQIAMKNRRMENVRIKIPSHLAVVFTEKRLIRLDEIMFFIEYALRADIRHISLYDPFGELVEHENEFISIARNMKIDLFMDNCLVHEDILAKMCLNVLSRKSSKNALVNVCKTLCERDAPITVEDITDTLHEQRKLKDPDFLLQIGNVPSLCGYPPWNLRITEFMQSSQLPTSRRALDYCIESFSHRDIRVGK